MIMETHTDTVQQAQENRLLKPLSEDHLISSPDPQGSPISPLSSIQRWFSFKSGHERLDLDLHTLSSFPSEKTTASLTEQQLQSPPKSSKRAVFLYGWWTFEILAFVVSFASLIAIIIILKYYDGRSLPDWPHSITLNSVLSWFITLYKTSLLVPIAACFGQTGWLHYRSTSQPLADINVYDSASRGPMGSLKLLWNFKVKYVASIGAIATILALGVDPIVQQTLSIRVNVLASNNSTTLGRAQSFVQWYTEDYSTSTILNPGIYSDPPPNSNVLLPPTDMVAAMFDGIFSGDGGSTRKTSGPNLFCPTGNCTFPPFQTLAVCSKCENITNALNVTCSYTRAKNPQGPPRATAFCEYSLPNGLKMNKTLGPSTVATNGGLTAVGSLPYSQSILNFTGIWSGAPAEIPYSGLPYKKNKPYNKSDPYDPNDPYDPHNIADEGKAEEVFLKSGDVKAIQCFLYWCVQTMKAQVINGRIEQTTTDAWCNKTRLPPDPITGVWVWTVSETDILTLQPPPLNPNGSSSTFIVARYASKALSDWLAAHLTITNSRNWENSTDFDPDPSHHEFEKQRLFLSNNVSTMFENLAASMTFNLRSTSIEDQSSTREGLITVEGASPANGTSTRDQILVSVRWPWLGFPVALLLLALAFFILTLLSTSRHRLEVWKTSPFPLIFNRIDDSQLPPQSEMEPIVQSVRIIDMEKKAAGIFARLEEWDVGPRLTESLGHLHHKT